MDRRTAHMIVIVVATAAVAYLNLVTMQGLASHVVLDELYYLPLLLGVVWFGLKGGVATYLLVSASYLPFVWDAWTAPGPQLFDRILHLASSAAFVLVAGVVAERDRKRHEQAEQERYFAGIGQASTVIVHDLKNPLIAIQGFARRILQGKGDTEQAARVILESTHTMQRIVSDVLEFARPIRLDPTAADVRECLQRTVELCLIKAEEKNVALALHLPPEPVVREVDCYLMQRALVNLIDNAVDASPPGASVFITADDGELGLRISIRDHGSGMDQQTLANLYAVTYTTKSGGTGFGIPISKKIVEAHGGTLRFISQKGSGTEVIIAL